MWRRLVKVGLRGLRTLPNQNETLMWPELLPRGRGSAPPKADTLGVENPKNWFTKRRHVRGWETHLLPACRPFRLLGFREPSSSNWIYLKSQECHGWTDGWNDGPYPSRVHRWQVSGFLSWKVRKLFPSSLHQRIIFPTCMQQIRPIHAHPPFDLERPILLSSN